MVTPERYIAFGGSVRLINDLLKYAADENIDGSLFVTDTGKAFDSADHNFILNIPKNFGFGNYFPQWVKLLLENHGSQAVRSKQLLAHCKNFCKNL